VLIMNRIAIAIFCKSMSGYLNISIYEGNEHIVT
jgi:hypothetical protein